MSTIRPLVTITILFAVGVLLWWKINDAPLVPPVDDQAASSAEDPLGELGGDMPALFSPSAEGTPPAPVATAPPVGDGPAAFPPLSTQDPLLPPPSGGGASASAMPAMPDLPLPDNIPSADFGENAGDSVASDLPAVSGAVPSLGTSTPNLPSPAPSSPIDPLAGSSLPPNPLDSIDPNIVDPLAPPATATAPPAGASDPAMSAGEFGTASAYAAAKPAIDAKLAANDLKGALMQLTEWYGDPSLSPAEQTEVDTLLAQLAGTVIYSTDHLMLPPHTVAAGETLESIAAQYQVPWQLLAKINGIENSNGVLAGQQVKVVRGPFVASVNLNRQELVLTADGHYAGRFSVTAGGDAATEGDWTVSNKVAQPNLTGETSRQITLSRSDNPGASVVLTADANAGGVGSPYSGAIRVAPSDEADLYDILSVGSAIKVVR